jgi:hypothetical protein
LQVTEIKDVFSPIYPSIVIIKKTIGIMSARAIIVQIITDVALFFNTGQNMNQDQVADLTEFILSDYYYLNIADLKLCFNNGKKGRYGKVFRVDGSIILEWLEKYTNDRLNAADEESYKEHQSTTGDRKLSGLENLYKKFEK